MRAEDQLRSMGDESEWQKFYEVDENPFDGRSVSRPLFLDQEPIVEQVEGNPKLLTISTTEYLVRVAPDCNRSYCEDSFSG